MASTRWLRSVCAIGCVALLVGFNPAAAQPSLHATIVYGIGADAVPAVHDVALVKQSRPDAAALTSALGDTLRDPWLGRDKALHAAGSFLLTLSAQYVLTSKLDMNENGALPIAAGTSFSLGLTKEVADSQRPVRPLFSVRDLVADAVGVALAVGLILL